MANALKLNRKIITPHNVIWEFLCTLSGSYVASSGVGTPGETLSFNTASNPKYIARPKIPGLVNGSTAYLPKTEDIKVLNNPGGFDAVVEQNATAPTPANYCLRIFGGGSGAAQPAELASGTYASVATHITDEPLVIQVYGAVKNV